MKIHKLKLDNDYFNDVESGIKNFEIRKNDRGFQVGDILELKRYNSELGYLRIVEFFCADEPVKGGVLKEGFLEQCEEDEADTIKVKVICILSALEVNEGIDFMNYNPKVSLFEDEALPFLKAGWRNNWNYDYFLNVLKEYFHMNCLPEDYVVLGIEVIR